MITKLVSDVGIVASLSWEPCLIYLCLPPLSLLLKEARATGQSKPFNGEALSGVHLAPLTQIEDLTLCIARLKKCTHIFQKPTSNCLANRYSKQFNKNEHLKMVLNERGASCSRIRKL